MRNNPFGIPMNGYNSPINFDENWFGVVACHKEFLQVLAQAVDKSGRGISYPLLKQIASFDDLIDNMGLACFAAGNKEINQYGFTAIDHLRDFMIENNELAPLADVDFMNSKADFVFSDINSMGEVSPDCKSDFYKLAVYGNTLFVGMQHGFGSFVRNKAAEQVFLTDCLEMCRTSMQNPALTASTLYRRFVFTNVNA